MRRKRRKGRVRSFQAGEGKSVEELRSERQSAAKKKKRIKFNRTRIVLTVIVLVMITGVVVSVANVFSLWSEQKELEATREKLLSEEEALKEELKNVNDVEYIEEQARMQLKLIKPGEILYILEEEQNQEKDDAGDTEKEN
ncbi:MAG: FtsB family cell division protein [Emergencia sp.]|nr:septum formation initiator family protein [Emergencia sp.]